jgi:type II secretory pathway pseudopilin PulG
MNMNIYNNQKGQGIVELVAAIAIIIFALAGIITLTLVNIIGQKASENSLIASNLAREGIEVVRNLRDTSWLTTGFLGDLVSPSDHTVTAEFDITGNVWTLNNSADSISEARLYLKNNLYVHDSVGSTPTNFYRLITVDFVCADGSVITSGTCSGGTNPVVGYRVKSKVQWHDKGGKTHNYELTDYIYDWK